MKEKEIVIGNYVTEPNSTLMRVNDAQRRHLITLLESLHKEKEYKEETLFLAASLADRYLVTLSKLNIVCPCLIKLAIVATLLAAKLE